MALNPYDETLNKLDEQQQTGPAPAAPVNPFLETLATIDQGRERKLRQSIMGADDKAPDRAGEAVRLSQRTGLPVSVIERNFEDIQKRARIADTPYAQMLKETPVLADYVAESPEQAAVVKDDMEQLGFLEWLTQAPGRAFSRGQAQVRFGQLSAASMFRSLTAQEREQLKADKAAMSEGGALGAGDSWFKGAITGSAQQLPNLFGAFLHGAKRGIPFGVTAGTGAALAGQLGPQVALPEEAITVPIAFAGGFTAGTMTGAAEFGFQLEAGLALDEYQEFKDELGQPLDAETAKAAALATGAMNAGLEAIGLGVLLKSIPGVKNLVGPSARAAVKQALRNPTVRAALGQAMKTYAGTLTAETSIEMAQRAVTIMSGELAKVASGQTIAGRGAGDIAADIANEGAHALQAFALLSAPGPAMSVVTDVVKARSAKHNAAFFTALGDGVTNSKTVQRMPEAAQEFLARATKDGPLETIYAPVEAWAKYWQSEGLDPREVAIEVTGDGAAYDNALATGEDLPIPTARYAVKVAGTKHNAALMPELRLGAEEMNLREAEAFEEQLQAQAGTAPVEESAPAIRTALLAELDKAGIPAETAQQYAALYESVFATMAQRAGVDPMALFQQYGLQVTREGFQDVAAAPAVVPAGAGQGLGLPAPGAPSTVPGAAPAAVQGEGAAAGPGQSSAAATGTEGAPAPSTGPLSPLDVEAGVREALGDLQDAPEVATLPGSGEEGSTQLGDQTEGIDAAGDPASRVGLRDVNPQPGSADAVGGADAAGGGDGTPARGRVDVPAPHAEHFAELLADARANGYTGSDDSLADLFLRALDDAETAARDLNSNESDGPTSFDLLKAIAKMGGFGIEEEAGPNFVYRRGKIVGAGGMVGELENLLESLTKQGQGKRQDGRRIPIQFRQVGKLPGGKPNEHVIKRKGGNTADRVLEAINEDGRWAFENLADFLEAVRDAVMIETGQMSAPGTGKYSALDILANVFDVRPGVQWWAPVVTDTLDTGELQARLPGDVGAVRDMEVSDPKLDLPLQSFDLTAPLGTEPSDVELFQAAFHGSPHIFDKFELNAIGTGEGNQSYGWGLYFASRREVADWYRQNLSGEGREMFNALTPEENQSLAHWIVGAIKQHGPETIDALIIDWDQRIASQEAELAESIQPWLVETRIAAMKETRAIFVKLKESGDLSMQRSRPGRTYKVELPESNVMLDWDRPASEQPPNVQEALTTLGIKWVPFKPKTLVQMRRWLNGATAQRLYRSDIGIRESLEMAMVYVEANDVEGLTRWQQQHQQYFRPSKTVDDTSWTSTGGVAFEKGLGDPTGEELYREIGVMLEREHLKAQGNVPVLKTWTMSQRAEATSRKLNELGVVGLRYKDGSSRGRTTWFYMGDPSYLLAALNMKDAGLTQAEAKVRLREAYKDADGSTLNAALDKAYEVKAPEFHNFVVFDDSLVQITEFDQPLFHGSPHDVDRFSLKNVGTGQGAQTYGWGLYFAENPAVAVSYHEQLAGEGEMLEMTLGTMRLTQRNNFNYSARASENTVENIRASLAEDLIIETSDLITHAGRIQAHVLEVLDAKIEQYREEWPEGVLAAQELRRELARKGAVSVKFAPRPGAVYTVDVADDAIEKMIDYDAPLAKQPKAFQEMVREALKAQGFMAAKDNGPRVLQSAMKAYAMMHGGMGDGATGGFAHQLLYEQMVLDAIQDVVKTMPLAETREESIERERQVRYKVEGNIPKALSMRLKEAGIPGLRYLDEGSRGNATGRRSRNVVVWDDEIITLTHKNGMPVSAAEKKAYTQQLDQELTQDDSTADTKGRRGFVRFGTDRKFMIGLMEKADLSTFLHESGHFYLEVFGDLVDALAGQDAETLTPEQRRMQSDYATLLDWLGVEGRAGIGREQHEQFARGFEAYLMRGESPNVSLNGAFARFRAWLLGVYRSLKSLNVELSEEVVTVFDRLVATDVAIQQAEQLAGVQPMFLTPQAAGMSEEEFNLYRSTVEAASRTAREQLDAKLMREVQRELTAEWKARRSEVEATVTNEVHERPVYQAVAAMQKGTTPAGAPLLEGLDPEPLKLSRATIVSRYGADRLKTLPKPYIYTASGGMDPDIVADMFGFSSGDEMLRAIETAPPMKNAIAAETDRRMLVEHGAIMLDGTLHEKATAALANEDRERIVRQELRALGQLRRIAKPFVKAGEEQLQAERRERAYERRWLEAEAKLKVAIAQGEKQVEIDALRTEVRHLRQKARGGAATIRAAIPPDATIRNAARQRIAGMKVRQLNPAPFWSASRRAAQLAIEAAARGDFEGAITLKQQELLNLALYREASDTREDIETRVRKAKDLSKPAARSRLGLAGESYLDQVDGILDRYSFAKVSQKALDRRASLEKWIAEQEGQGMPIDLPDEVLNEVLRTPYQELTVEQLIGVTDGLDMIVHLAQLKNRLLKAQKQRELDEVVEDMTAAIREHGPKRSRGQRRDRGPAAERRRMIGSFFASHRKLASLARQMDGFIDGGPVWEALIRPLNEAGDSEATMNADATRRLAALINTSYPGRSKSQLYEKTFIPEIGTSLTHEHRIMVALNWGNEGNRQRVMSSEKWDAGQVQAVLDGLTLADWQFVQGTLDMINSYWEEIAEKQKRVTGVAPTKVDAAPIETNYGRFAGGYFPIKYDDRLSATAAAHLDLDAGLAAKQAAYVKATTRRGHTKERVAKTKLPLRLDFGVITEHLQGVIHDLTHHEALIDVSRVLQDRRVQSAIFDTYGDLVYKQFKESLKDIALGDVPATNGFEKAIHHLRVGATIAGLAWNLTTSLLQPLGLTQSMVRIGPRWVGRGLSRWLRDAASMENTVAWVTDKSSMMANRGRTQQREINEIRNQIGMNTGKLGGWVDEVLGRTTFDTVTRQGIADSYFFLIQQLQRVADIPTWIGAYEKSMAADGDEGRAIALADQAVLDAQAGGQIKDLAAVQRGGPMLKLWTNFYSFFNTTYNLTVESTRRTKFSHPGHVGRLAVDYLLLYIVPASMGFFVRAAMRGDLPEDEEELMEGLVRENLAYLSGTMLGLRELGGTIQGFQGYEGPAGARGFAALARFGAQVQQGEADAAFWRALNDSAGILFHYPAGQVRRTIEGSVALAEGDADNPLVVVTGPPR